MATALLALGTTLLGSVAAGGATAATALSVGFGAFQGLMAIGQGIAQSKDLKTQAAQETAAAEQERTRGAQESREQAERFAVVAGDQSAAVGASGTTPFGSPQTIRRETTSRFSEDQRITLTNARARESARRVRASSLKNQAKGALASGIVKGVGVTLNAVTGSL